MALRPVLREFQRLEKTWGPIIEVCDPPAQGPFSALWEHEMASIRTVFNPLMMLTLESDLTRQGRDRQRRARHEAHTWAYQHRIDVGPLIDSPGAFSQLAWRVVCHLKFAPEQGEHIRELLTVRVMRTKKLRELVRSNWADLQFIEHYEKPKSRTALPADLESDLYKHFVEKVLDDRRLVHDDFWAGLHMPAEHFVLNLLAKVRVRKQHSVPLLGDDEDLNVLEDTALTELAMQARDERLYETHEEIEAFLTRLATKQVLALIRPLFTDRQSELVDLLMQGRTVKEAAAKMGISPDTAYVYLYQVRSLHIRFSL